MFAIVIVRDNSLRLRSELSARLDIRRARGKPRLESGVGSPEGRCGVRDAADAQDLALKGNGF